MHDFYAVGAIEGGAHQLRCRGTTHLARPGSILALDPGEIHGTEPVGTSGWSYRMFYLRRDVLSHFLSVPESRLSMLAFEAPIIDDPALAQALLAVHRQLTDPVTEADMGMRVQLRAMTRALRRLFTEHCDARPARRTGAGAHHVAVHEVRDYIHGHVTSSISLSTLAEIAGMSPFHLIRLFRREFDVSPYAYVKQLRVSCAQDLLRSGMNVTGAAYAAGFSDQSHLTRSFKQVLGVTPGAFARAISRQMVAS